MLNKPKEFVVQGMDVDLRADPENPDFTGQGKARSSDATPLARALRFLKRSENPQLEILHRVSGVFKPGVLTALVGVSGAGVCDPSLVGLKHKSGKEGLLWEGVSPEK